jgi:hypothetical protein
MQRDDARRRRRIDSPRSAYFEIAAVTHVATTGGVDAVSENSKMLSCFLRFNRCRVQIGALTSQTRCKRLCIPQFKSATHVSSVARRFTLRRRRRRWRQFLCVYTIYSSLIV